MVLRGDGRCSSRARFQSTEIGLSLGQLSLDPLIIGILVGGFIANWFALFRADGTLCICDLLVDLLHQWISWFVLGQKFGSL